jgi:hypothetical protein
MIEEKANKANKEAERIEKSSEILQEVKSLE